MSNQRHLPRRTRPDLGRPTDKRAARREARLRATDDPEALVEGVTGVRAEPQHLVEPSVETMSRRTWLHYVLAGVGAAVAGWVLTTVLVTIAWFAVPMGSLGAAMVVAVQVWLAGHGGGLYLDDTVWTLVPYGLAALWCLLLTVVLRAVVPQDPGTDDAGDGDSADDPGDPAAPAIGGDDPGSTRWHSALAAAGYVVPLLVAATLTGPPQQAMRVLVGGLVVAMLALAWARPRRPRWMSHRVVVATLVGVGTMVATGAAALATALVLRRDHVGALVEELGGGVFGGLLTLFVQVLYLPQAVMWALSYGLGAGFTLGPETRIDPVVTQVGMIPGWPLLGAVPAGAPEQPWALLWALGGVLAGALATVVVLRGTPYARPDTCAVAGGGMGLLVGVATTALALATRGDLGVERMVGLGPRPLPMLVMACLVALVGGLVAGAVIGGMRSLRQRSGGQVDEPEEFDEHEEDEEVREDTHALAIGSRRRGGRGQSEGTVPDLADHEAPFGAEEDSVDAGRGPGARGLAKGSTRNRQERL